jgi:hypothetical protein
MADKKISALTSASTPLAGTEVLPIVQSGSTVKVAVSNLTEGRSISALSLGLGVASPAYTFDFRSGATATTGQFISTNATAYSAGGYNGGIARFFLSGGNGTSAANGFELTAGGNNENFFGVVQEAGGSGAFVFQGYNGASYGERFRVASNGDATVNNGNLVIGTSGKGIDFSATTEGSGTMTSELLADYEEGNFTPTISGSTTAGTGTYNAQGAFYTKVGNIVNVQIYINLATHTGTGNIRITGLPFTSAAGGNTYSSATIGYLDNCTLVASNYPLAFIPPSTTYINLSQSPVGGGALNDVAMDTLFSIMISATYRAA